MWNVQAEVYLSPWVKYGFDCADFHAVLSLWAAYGPNFIQIGWKFWLHFIYPRKKYGYGFPAPIFTVLAYPTVSR